MPMATQHLHLEININNMEACNNTYQRICCSRVYTFYGISKSNFRGLEGSPSNSRLTSHNQIAFQACLPMLGKRVA